MTKECRISAACKDFMIEQVSKTRHEAKELLRQFDEESGNTLNAVKEATDGEDKGPDKHKKKKFFK